jgi:RND family efflux transporter MFP subunit
MHWILTRVLLPGAILAGAGFGASTLVQSAETAEKEPPAPIAPLVDVVTVHRASLPAHVVGTGVVEAEREVTLSAEVSGRLTKVSENLVVGGRVEMGDFIAKIDGRTYDLAVRQENSQVAKAESDLEVEKGRGVIAEREWELLSKDAPKSKRSALALREPQREAAEVALASARAARDRAKFDRSRTRIMAPFNATITQESVEVGAYMSPGSQVATLVGTDAFRVRVSLPIEDLALIDIPGLHAETGSKARVLQELGSRTIEREGTVVRLVGELDADSRTAQVLVEVKDPLDPPKGELPLLPGAFVRVEIDGKQAQDIAPVPRNAVVEGNRVWVVAQDDTIVPRQLSVAWADAETVYARDGVNDGDRLMVTDLPTLVKGMRVRVSDAKEPIAEAPKDEASDAG